MKPSGQTYIRSVAINQEEIPYKLRYSKKARYVRLQISRSSGLELILPRGYDLIDAEKFLLKKSGWIKKHLHSVNHTAKKYKFLGNEIKLIQEFEFFTKKHKINLINGELKITSPAGSKADPGKIYLAWLKHCAKEYLAPHAFKLARENKFKVNKISVRGQKTRWGSCSTNGNLSFNFMLMEYRREVIDYVIFHELCHLKELNHSKNFWSLVERLCPDYKLFRKELKGFGEI